MKTICERAGLIGNYTNHSGKRTCATQLYMGGVDEQEIMSRTGHRSERSVRKYKQSCPAIQKEVASILDPPSPAKKMKCNVLENSVQGSVKQQLCDKKLSDIEDQEVRLKDITNCPRGERPFVHLSFNFGK